MNHQQIPDATDEILHVTPDGFNVVRCTCNLETPCANRGKTVCDYTLWIEDQNLVVITELASQA